MTAGYCPLDTVRQVFEIDYSRVLLDTKFDGKLKQFQETRRTTAAVSSIACPIPLAPSLPYPSPFVSLNLDAKRSSHVLQWMKFEISVDVDVDHSSRSQCRYHIVLYFSNNTLPLFSSSFRDARVPSGRDNYDDRTKADQGLQLSEKGTG